MRDSEAGSREQRGDDDYGQQARESATKQSILSSFLLWTGLFTAEVTPHVMSEYNVCVWGEFTLKQTFSITTCDQDAYIQSDKNKKTNGWNSREKSSQISDSNI